MNNCTLLCSVLCLPAPVSSSVNEIDERHRGGPLVTVLEKNKGGRGVGDAAQRHGPARVRLGLALGRVSV